MEVHLRPNSSAWRHEQASPVFEHGPEAQGCAKHHKPGLQLSAGQLAVPTASHDKPLPSRQSFVTVYGEVSFREPPEDTGAALATVADCKPIMRH